MVTLVVMPTAAPASRAQSAMLLTLSLMSAFMPSAPLWVLLPVARAVPPAAESVMPLLALCVFTSAKYGNEGKQRGSMPILPSMAAWYVSAAFTWFTPMPSPIK